MESKPAVLLALVVALVAAPSIQARSITYCDKKHEYAVKVSDVQISPDPIQRGVETTFSILASSDEAISGGKMSIDVSYFGFNVHSEKHDLCEKTSCPVGAGDFVVSHSQVLPIFTPPGSYTLKLRMDGANGEHLTCINFDFSIGFLVADS